MRTDYNGKITRQSGDINLIAAMMACGIMLDHESPCRVMDSEDGRTYSSFSYLPFSADGTTSADRLMAHWLGSIVLPDDDGFPVICQFIKSRPKGAQRSHDLFDFAMTWLESRGHKIHGLASFDGIPAYVASLPKSEASYVLAYVWNREICYLLHKRVGRSVHLGDASKNGGRCAIISEKLPQWQRKELLSRYLG